jgi:hypothetical protein
VAALKKDYEDSVNACKAAEAVECAEVMLDRVFHHSGIIPTDVGPSLEPVRLAMSSLGWDGPSNLVVPAAQAARRGAFPAAPDIIPQAPTHA